VVATILQPFVRMWPIALPPLFLGISLAVLGLVRRANPDAVWRRVEAQRALHGLPAYRHPDFDGIIRRQGTRMLWGGVALLVLAFVIVAASPSTDPTPVVSAPPVPVEKDKLGDPCSPQIGCNSGLTCCCINCVDKTSWPTGSKPPVEEHRCFQTCR
jgi:hypothetical protein